MKKALKYGGAALIVLTLLAGTAYVLTLCTDEGVLYFTLALGIGSLLVAVGLK
jgi:hypothetical protein